MISIRMAAVAEVLAATALISEYAAECSIPAIGEISPQADAYAALEKSGLLRGFMVFDDGIPKGFAIVLTPILPHYGKRVATIESLFMSKAGRRGGLGLYLMRAVESHATDEGCVGILYSAPAGGQLERLLAANADYERTNAVFYRRLQ